MSCMENQNFGLFTDCQMFIFPSLSTQTHLFCFLQWYKTNFNFNLSTIHIKICVKVEET